MQADIKSASACVVSSALVIHEKILQNDILNERVQMLAARNRSWKMQKHDSLEGNALRNRDLEKEVDHYRQEISKAAGCT